MRYIYYIIGLFVLVTATLALLWKDKTSVDISSPAITINDRIITESELQDRMAGKPHDMTDEQFIDSLIMQELLIQEALKQNIHKEESFRRSVESFYEQSLIKILLDRKYRESSPEVADAEIEACKRLSGMQVRLTKRTYPTREAARSGQDPAVRTMISPFAFLSDSLQFTLLSLRPGETSAPLQTAEGFVTYSLEQILPLNTPSPAADTEQMKKLIADQKKEQLYEQWADGLKEKAQIWRRK